MVFRALSALPLFKRRLETAGGIRLHESQLDRLAVFAFFHDVGKTNLGFQNKGFDPNTPRAGHILELAPLFFEPDLCQSFFNAFQAEELLKWFDSEKGLDGFFIAALSHHGMPVRYDPAQKTGNYYPAKDSWWKADGQRDPFAEIAALMSTAKATYPSAFESDVPPLPSSPELQHRFAGLLMLADWLGSHEAFFPIVRETDDPIAYSYKAAKRALNAVGLISSAFQDDIVTRPAGFHEWFGFKPRPLQAAMDQITASDKGYRLLIAEAETGSGKTEAALVHFFRLFMEKEVDSLYFALPTRVAARELYRRVYILMTRVFPDAALRPNTLLAVPGYAQVNDVSASRILPDESVQWNDDSKIYKTLSFWASEHPKRFLAATIAVGTIDQALLSILQTRHVHLRSVCLDRSFLVVDEVHSSDPYMRQLLQALLKHHVGTGGHALLLSATLGSRMRSDLINLTGSAKPAPSYLDALSAPYPVITCGPENSKQIAIPKSMEPKTVNFEPRFSLSTPDSLLPDIALAAKAGARILIVLNTVARVIALQRAVEKSPDIPNEILFQCEKVTCPHHGRFAPSDREIMDKALSNRLGKDSPSGPLIAIGSQTLEQSLDIDADILMTDLCPSDVLLQRIGRLHRHHRRRPAGYEIPRCIVILPVQGDLAELMDNRGQPAKEARQMGLGSVYPDLRCLELTRRLLLERPKVSLPKDNRLLVEKATHPDRLKDLQDLKWIKHGILIDGGDFAQQISAHYATAAFNQHFGDFIFNEFNASIRTRLGIDSLRLPLDKPVKGPFGRTITEMLIPGHLAPAARSETNIRVLSNTDQVILLGYENMRFFYSRYGLEKADESSDKAPDKG